jgi:hypothetical protein
MNPIGALKLLPKVHRARVAVKAVFAASPGAAQARAAEEATMAIVPLIEGFLGEDAVNDAQLADAIEQIYEAVHAAVMVARDVQARNAKFDIGGQPMDQD